jgi:hypothetical protein
MKRYACTKCSIFGVKLWRNLANIPIMRVLCKECGEKDQEARLGSDLLIGELVPAYPTDCPDLDGAVESGSTYWNYRTAPPAVTEWWDSLPTRISN